LNQIAFFIRNLRTMGAVAPSSKYLAQRMVIPLKKWIEAHPKKGVRVLELGPGTGATTKYIQPLLRPIDHVDIVELNPSLHEYVSERYASNAMHFYNLNFLDFQIEQPYDFIFSGIPYEALPVQVIDALWQKKMEACHNQTIVTYFKYINPINFKSKLERKLIDQHCIEVGYEFRNIPPARFFRLKLK